LKRINYSGETTYFIAVSKVNGREDFYSTKKERDAAVSLGTHEKPTDELVPSKRGEIYRNIALILIQKGQIEEAKKAIQEARIANPNDDSLILSEADLYLKTKDIDTYKKLISEVLEKNPNNFELIFNLGVVSYTNKDFVNAEKYYLRVIELNPNYANAYFNMSALKIDQATTMLDNMNKLSTSAADNKKYDAMKKERDALLVVIQGYLEKTIALDDSNIDAKQALVTVYNALEMSAKAKALKENIKAQESKQ
jgi:tetratricopeptide (TPR) repeat protein